jgi:hypothetical protein
MAMVLYAFGALSGAFAFWSMVRALIAITEAMQSGMPFFSYGYVFTEHFMAGSNTGTWIVYTLVLLALGRILHVQLGGVYDETETEDIAEPDEDETETEPEKAPIE